MLTGWLAYILVSFQGSHQALRSVNLMTHFTQYVPGHAHLALLFFSASVIMGGMYYVIPRVFDCKIYSRLWPAQYSFYVVGFLFFFLGFLLTGVVQGSSWVQEGLPVWTVLPGLRSYMAMRARRRAPRHQLPAVRLQHVRHGRQAPTVSVEPAACVRPIPRGVPPMTSKVDRRR